MQATRDPRLALEDAVVVAAGGEPEVVRATGADRVSFLHRLLTSDVAGTPPGRGGRSLLLTVKGHVVCDMQLCVGADDVRLVVPPGQGDAVASMLARYAVMDDFAAARDPDLRALDVIGPRAAERLAAAGVAAGAGPPWSHEEVEIAAGPDAGLTAGPDAGSVPGPDVGPGAVSGKPGAPARERGRAWIVRMRVLGAPGLRVFASADAREALSERLAAAGVCRLDDDIAEALRIEAGEPTWGAEITPEFFPMEVGRADAIDGSKGCYLGQEPIVRIRDRGHVNWRLARIDIDGEIVPARGDALESDARPRAGRIASAGRLPGRPPVALAHVHASVPDGAAVRVRHGDASLPARVRALG